MIILRLLEKRKITFYSKTCLFLENINRKHAACFYFDFSDATRFYFEGDFPFLPVPPRLNAVELTELVQRTVGGGSSPVGADGHRRHRVPAEHRRT